MTIKEFQEKEIWTTEDYQHSLELLRNDKELTQKCYNIINNDIFDDVLDFSAGWLERFEILEEDTKEEYQVGFKKL